MRVFLLTKVGRVGSCGISHGSFRGLGKHINTGIDGLVYCTYGPYGLSWYSKSKQHVELKVKERL